MKYQLFPNLTLDEMEALTADIAERGVMVPVEVDEDGAILDGHHRAMIADSLGIGYPTVVRAGWTEEQKLTHVVALNAHRRHLAGDQRREVVARLRRERMSTRAIARAVGVDQSTVVRDLAGDASASPAIDADASMPVTIGTDGKSYPAQRPRPEPPADYIDLMPPAEQAWERDFRKTTLWFRQLDKGMSALLSIPPDDHIALLTPADRESTEQWLGMFDAWITKTRKALHETSGLRTIGGRG